jgi:signal peptidase
MEPDYPVGSLIYVRKVDYTTLKPNDVITYRLDEKTLSTHRIVRVQTEGGYRFYMKGDANNGPDGAPVLPEDILGEIVFAIPLLGYVAFYIQHPPGLYIAIAVGAILVMLTFWPDLLQSEQKKSPSAEAKEESQAHI